MIFVFEVRVKEGYSAQAYARAWVEASELIQRATGAKGTRLHRKLDDPRALLAVASWQSKEARDRAEAERDPRVQAIFAEQARWVDIRVLGAFDEAEWVVLPEERDDVTS